MKDLMPVGLLVSAIVYAGTNSYNAIMTTANYLDTTKQVQMSAVTSKSDIVVKLTYDKSEICGVPTVELKPDE